MHVALCGLLGAGGLCAWGTGPGRGAREEAGDGSHGALQAQPQKCHGPMSATVCGSEPATGPALVLGDGKLAPTSWWKEYAEFAAARIHCGLHTLVSDANGGCT